MSEFLNNSSERKAKLKTLILKLHDGESVEKVRKELMESLSNIPYGEVVEVEQELISDGLPETEVLKLCDVHSAVLQGNIDLRSAKTIPDGHPVDLILKENIEVKKVAIQALDLLEAIEKSNEEIQKVDFLKLLGLFNNLYDIDKHYKRKEYLLFPYLEKGGITGPPKVMWGKHDEIRELLKGSIELLQTENITKDEFSASAEIILKPALNSVLDMIVKEEEILLPMSMDKLTESDWYEISKQSLEIGFCLYDPQKEWKPSWIKEEEISANAKTGNYVQFPTGVFSTEELLSIMNTIPFDMTFVDKDDKVKYYTQGTERIFQRNRAILNRDVRHCHPPASAHIVDKILDDFKSGKAKRAPFWINMGGKFIHIEYFALHNEKGEYMGTLEVSQDLTKLRALEGEKRILSYE